MGQDTRRIPAKLGNGAVTDSVRGEVRSGSAGVVATYNWRCRDEYM